MSRFCRWAVRVFLVLWALAVALLAIGTFGLFGQAEDPLAGVFLLPLGMPWVLWTDALPERLLPAAALLAPGLNLALLAVLCRALSSRRRQG